MANAFTATELLASLKRRGLLPTTTSTFSTSDYLKFVDEEIQTYIVPLLLEVNEEYLVTTQDVTLTSTNSYYIPERSIAGGLRKALIADGNGGYNPLVRYEPDNISDFPTSSGNATGYYVQGNSLVLVPAQTSGTMRLTYCARPNRMVATTAVGEVSSIVGNVVSFASTAPTTFTTSLTYDIVKGKPGFDSLAIDQAVTAVGASSVTFTATPPSSLAVGDYVCISQESPIPQVPVELHPLIAQRVAGTVLAALGDAKSEGAFMNADKMEKKILKALKPRIQGSSRVVVNRYGVGMGSGIYPRRRY